jgi:uncharacterized membrane protein YraQ (UPF0718 family)
VSNLILYGIALTLLFVSFAKSRDKTVQSLKRAYQSFIKNIPSLIPMMIAMGMLLSIVNTEFISNFFGQESGLVGIVLSIVIGSVSFMPSFIAFPFGANLLEFGAGYPQVAGFISSLMAIGIVSFGMESKYFGVRVALARNIVALIASVVFVILVGVIM